MKLLKEEWGDKDAGTNAEAGPSTNVAFSSPMKVGSTHEAPPTLFGIDAEEFNKLTDINELRKCWTYCTSKSSHHLVVLFTDIFTAVVDPTWNEGHQLLWKGRLARYASKGIRVTSYPPGCLVPGQNLLAVSKGIADTPGDQVKNLLSAFGVPGHATVEQLISFEIVDNKTKDRK